MTYTLCDRPSVVSRVATGWDEIVTSCRPLSLVVLLATIAGCGDTTSATIEPTPSQLAHLRASVSGSAAQAIGSEGKLQLASPANENGDELSAATAMTLASQWVRQYGPIMRNSL